MVRVGATCQAEANTQRQTCYYITSLAADAREVGTSVRQHWGIENRLHHVKDRTWLEDRHWVGNKRTGAVVTILRSVACGIAQKARFADLNPNAHCPERIEYFNQHPQQALRLLKGEARL